MLKPLTLSEFLARYFLPPDQNGVTDEDLRCACTKAADATREAKASDPTNFYWSGRSIAHGVKVRNEMLGWNS